MTTTANWLDGGNKSSDDFQNKLDLRLSELVDWFRKSNPKSANAAAAAATVLPGGNTRTVLHSFPFPLAAESGKNTTITSKDGVEYTNFVSEYTSGIFGHSHPRIHKAVQEALQIGINLGSVTGKEAEMGMLIQKRFPSMELMRFTNSGTEANTLAISAALAHSGRDKVLVFARGYHGSTLSFPVDQKPRTNLPYNFVIGEYNDVAATKQLLSDDIGAILVEPVQSAGGVIPATSEFLGFLRNAATTLNAVLIFDEVVTSRLHYDGMQGFYGIAPDMTTLGKWIGGGFSFGCFGGKRHIMEQFDPSKPNYLSHSGTFNNNIFTMTAGIEGLKIVSAEEIERMNAMGDRLRTGIDELVFKAGLSSRIQARGFGSMIGFKFLGAAGETPKDIFYFEMLKRQIAVGRRGFVALNLIHTDADIDHFLQAVQEFLESLSQLRD
ncbi:hypothetical protein EKO04_007232 [Ascochyta lentis]|uniref:Aminotransferase class-III n=1 Tax=Ascochyta lentis TaxID=205686 RepID=A0A8H7MFS5_9PLEO|nr:hypothetical protein EKO04_007232 [Ascochyta lentis]